MGTSLHAWAPFHKTSPVEGRATDATTGEPIENVLIQARWLKKSPRIAIEGGIGAAKAYPDVTDKNGMYRIPSKITFHFLPLFIVGSEFYLMNIMASHPLYICEQKLVHWKDRDGDGEWKYKVIDKNKNKLIEILETKNGVVQYNIKLPSLEDKFVKPLKNMTDQDILLCRQYIDLQRRYSGRSVNGLSNDEKKRIKEEYDHFHKSYGNIVRLRNLLLQFQGNISGNLEGMAWTFNSGKKPVELDWNIVLKKYEELIDFIIDLKVEPIYNMIPKNYKKAKEAYLAYQEKHN